MANSIDSAARIVAALITRNGGTMEQVEDMLAEVHTMLKRIEDVSAVAEEKRDIIKETVFHDGIISLIDGKKLKNLKTYLTYKGMTPDEYRKKFNLPDDYPMVCKELSEKRVEIAKDVAFWDKSEENKHGKGITGNA